jgi:DNA-binding protein
MASETSNVDTATPPDKTDDNAVFVGRNGVMDRVMAIMPRFNMGADEVRGKRGDMIRRSWIELFLSGK